MTLAIICLVLGIVLPLVVNKNSAFYLIAFASASGIFFAFYHNSIPGMAERDAAEREAARKAAVQREKAEHPSYRIDDVGGCEVWTFYSTGRWHYLAKCPDGRSTVTKAYACGKNTCYESATTDNKEHK